MSFSARERPLHISFRVALTLLVTEPQGKQQLSEHLQEILAELYKPGKLFKNIFRDLKMPISGVQTLIKNWKIKGSVDTKT